MNLSNYILTIDLLADLANKLGLENLTVSDNHILLLLTKNVDDKKVVIIDKRFIDEASQNKTRPVSRAQIYKTLKKFVNYNILERVGGVRSSRYQFKAKI